MVFDQHLFNNAVNTDYTWNQWLFVIMMKHLKEAIFQMIVFINSRETMKWKQKITRKIWNDYDKRGEGEGHNLEKVEWDVFQG